MNREILLLFFPVMAAFSIPAGHLASKKLTRPIALAAFLSGGLYAALLMPGVLVHSRAVVLGSWPWGVNLLIGPLALGVVLLIYWLAAVVLTFPGTRPGQTYLLYCLLVAALVGQVLTSDLFSLFLFLELAFLALAGLMADTPREPAAAWRFLIGAQATALFLLAGLALLYSATGTLNLAVLARSPSLKPSLSLLITIMILLPLFVELQPILLIGRLLGKAGSLAQVSLLLVMSSLVSPAAMVVLARLLSIMRHPGSAFGRGILGTLLFLLGTAMVLIGETATFIAAFRRETMVKLLARSTVGQMGMAILGIAAGTMASLKGALLVLVSHSLAKALLLLAAGSVIHGRLDRRTMVGMGRKFPGLAALFLLGTFSLLGFPPLPGFWGKLELIRGLAAAGGTWYPGLVAVGVGTILQAAYLFPLVRCLFQPSSRSRGKVRGSGSMKLGFPLRNLVLLLLLAVMILMIGLLPGFSEPWLDGCLRELLNPQSAYADIILQGPYTD